MRQERCSRIWRPRSPTARTALMGSASCAAIVSMPSVRQPRPRRCGGWSIRRIDAAHLPRVRAARAAARSAAWAAGAAPAAGGWRPIDIDATLVIDHSDNKAEAAPTWKKTFGHHPLLAFLDRPEIAGGEPLAGLLRPGNAGSNTAADHITVLKQALASLPARWRPELGDPAAPQVLVRCDSAGATHGFAEACRSAGVGFSLDTPSMPASKTPSTPSTSATAGTRPSTPTAESGTGRGLPRPPPWSTCRPGRPARG